LNVERDRFYQRGLAPQHLIHRDFSRVATTVSFHIFRVNTYFTIYMGDIDI
jgi:hypothetical protein